MSAGGIDSSWESEPTRSARSVQADVHLGCQAAAFSGDGAPPGIHPHETGERNAREKRRLPDSLRVLDHGNAADAASTKVRKLPSNTSSVFLSLVHRVA